jgi:hypothetical protein
MSKANPRVFLTQILEPNILKYAATTQAAQTEG